MINFLAWLVVGGVIGWLGSLQVPAGKRTGLVVSMVVGIVGAFAAAAMAFPMVGAGTINQSDLSFPGLLISLMGAAVLLALVNFFRKPTVR